MKTLLRRHLSSMAAPLSTYARVLPTRLQFLKEFRARPSEFPRLSELFLSFFAFFRFIIAIFTAFSVCLLQLLKVTPFFWLLEALRLVFFSKVRKFTAKQLNPAPFP